METLVVFEEKLAETLTVCGKNAEKVVENMSVS